MTVGVGEIAGLARLPAAIVGPCRDCGATSTRTLGRHPYCDDCADQWTADLRCRILARDGLGVGVIAGHREPDLGPRIWQLACSVCRATWSGRNGDPCPWCVAAAERQRLDQRELLLDPAWLRENSLRYDDLSDVDKAVWNRTRGQTHGEGLEREWARRLGRAVEAGIITEAEADAALTKASTDG